MGMDTWMIFWAFVIGFAVYDGSLDWANSGGLNHTFRAFLRISVIILLSYIQYDFNEYYTAGAFKLACYRFAWFWIVFDIVANTTQFRRKIFSGELRHIFYLGGTAFLDWVFRAVWNVNAINSRESAQSLRHGEVAATVSQYVVKLLLLAATYQWANFTSDYTLF